MNRTRKKFPLTVGAVALVALTLTGCEVKGSGRFAGIGPFEGQTAQFSTETEIDLTGLDPSSIDWDELESKGEFKLKGLVAAAGASKKSSSEWNIELKFSLEKLLKRIDDLAMLPTLATSGVSAAGGVSALGTDPQCVAFLGEYKGKGLWSGPSVAHSDYRDRGIVLGLLAQGSPMVASASAEADLETYLFILAVSYELIWETFPGFTTLSSEDLLSVLNMSWTGGLSAASTEPGLFYWFGEATKAKFKFDTPIGSSCLGLEPM